MIDMTGTPAYRQVADDLRKQIADGTLPIGQAIGSTSQLMARYSVSSTVVRKAVELLREEGLLIGQPGKGVFIRRTPDQAAAESVTLDDLAQRIEALEARGVSHSKVDGLEEVRSLRQELVVLRTYVIDLYARMGFPYPHEDGSAEDLDTREARHGAGPQTAHRSA
jgi:DNA-binding transcriptional regulator YhcF (GntR family)